MHLPDCGYHTQHMIGCEEQRAYRQASVSAEGRIPNVSRSHV
jgi:hypothetical protein